MAQVTVSPKFQVVIPLHVRNALSIRPGQKIEVLLFDGRIELIPVKTPQEMRGFLRGMRPGLPDEGERDERS